MNITRDPKTGEDGREGWEANKDRSRDRDTWSSKSWNAQHTHQRPVPEIEVTFYKTKYLKLEEPNSFCE